MTIEDRIKALDPTPSLDDDRAELRRLRSNNEVLKTLLRIYVERDKRHTGLYKGYKGAWAKSKG